MFDTQLKPCVCGQKPQIRYKRRQITGSPAISLFYVECNFCGKQNEQGARFHSKKNAIDDWNETIGDTIQQNRHSKY